MATKHRERGPLQEPTTGEAPSPAVPFTASDLGFETLANGGWRKRVGERDVVFRPLRRVPELLAVEDLQRAIFGVDDRDLAAASQFVVVQETGGEVIGAFVGATESPAAGEAEPVGDAELVGFVVGWGGYRDRRPVFVSDMLGVRADVRNAGLGAALKKLQAAIALERGFPRIVWTVDPLRAVNARLNFEKLGAIADRYEEDRYGARYASGLYGGLPSDRLHVTWSLDSPRVRDRLLGRTGPTALADVAGLTHYEPQTGTGRALVSLPAEIDRLLDRDPDAALRWRLTLRETLRLAFAEGFRITGFVANVGEGREHAAYVIER